MTVELPTPLVGADWLAAHVGQPGLIVADVRWYPDRSARAAYEAGHIPSAIFVHQDHNLAARPGGGRGRHPLPTVEAFAASMSHLGIGDGTAVVAYDDAGGSFASRLWWMLRALGRQAAVLDGGMASWTGGLERGTVTLPEAVFTAAPWPAGAVVDVSEVDRLRADPTAVLLDARAGERYRGEVEPFDAVAGHIPGARSAPWASNLDPRTGRFLGPEALRERYAALGVEDADVVVAYCGSGITACHDLLALEVAGITGARLHPGSWSEWIADPARPIAIGDEP